MKRKQVARDIRARTVEEIRAGRVTATEAAAKLGVHPATVRNWLYQEKAEVDELKFADFPAATPSTGGSEQPSLTLGAENPPTPPPPSAENPPIDAAALLAMLEGVTYMATRLICALRRVPMSDEIRAAATLSEAEKDQLRPFCPGAARYISRFVADPDRLAAVSLATCWAMMVVSRATTIRVATRLSPTVSGGDNERARGAAFTDEPLE